MDNIDKADHSEIPILGIQNYLKQSNYVKANGRAQYCPK